jgi:hypothetical protein
MLKSLVFPYAAVLVAASSLLAQDYKLESIATGAPSLADGYTSLIAGQGYRVNGASGPWCEIWFRNSIPTGAKPSDPAITLPMAQGTLVAVIRFPAAAADRRGQSIKPGVYTMRYSNNPVDGAHLGVAPQRDFLLLTPLANDPDPNAMPDFATLVSWSRKASGTPHPAVFSIETPAGSTFPDLTKEGDHDTVLNVKIGDLQVAIIVAGKYEG